MTFEDRSRVVDQDLTTGEPIYAHRCRATHFDPTLQYCPEHRPPLVVADPKARARRKTERQNKRRGRSAR